MSKLFFLFVLLRISAMSAGCFDCLCGRKSAQKQKKQSGAIHGQLLITSKNMAYVSIKSDPSIKKLTQNSNVSIKNKPHLMIPILAFSVLKKEKTVIWSEGMPRLDDNDSKKRFVRYLPYAILAQLKEGHYLNLIWNNKKIRLKCSQKGYLFDAKSFHVHLQNYNEHFNWTKKTKDYTTIN